MNSPTVVYAGLGFFAGALSGFTYTNSPNLPDLLVGASFGVFAGVLLAFSKYSIWNRK